MGAAFLLTLLSGTDSADCYAQKLIFVHYANNTAPAGADAENHRVTIERLEQIDHPKAIAIAKNLREEPKLMAEALHADRTILREQLVARLGIILCEFDNESVRDGTFKCWLPEELGPKLGSVQVEPTGDYVLDGNPLATSEGLKASLLAVAKEFSPKEHRFVLVTQSHGSSELALTVKLARKHQEISFEDFSAMFHGDTVTYDLPTVGVTKSEYFDILRSAGEEKGMHFPVVILETCKGTIDTPLAKELPNNVESFFSSGQRFLEFRSLPYDKIVQTATSPEELVAAIDFHLHRNFLRIRRKQALPIWTWSLPLFLIVSWQVAKTLLNKRSSQPRSSDNPSTRGAQR